MLDLLAAGEAADLARALAEERGAPPESADSLLAAALYALTGHYLVEIGRAQWAVCWTGPSRLIAADIAADELSDLTSAAVRRPVTEVARLRLHLAALRLDPAATAPVGSLLRARAKSGAGLGAGSRGSPGQVRIVAGADLVTAQRISNIRMFNIIIGVITAGIALFGIHAWHSAHSEPSFTSVSPFVPPTVPSPLISPFTGINLPTVLPTPLLPAPGVLTPRLLTTIFVQPGDSLSAIACRYDTSVRTLQRLNHLGRSTLIDPGQRLIVPVTFAIVGAC